MKPTDSYVIQRCTEMESLLEDATHWANGDAKLGAHLAGYITVLISGVVEDCVEYLIKKRAGKGGDGELQELVAKLVAQQFGNPRHERITEILGWFSEDYARKYRAKVPSDAPDALGSILANRLALAHTGTWKQQMTVSDVREYFVRIQPILKVVEDVLT